MSSCPALRGRPLSQTVQRLGRLRGLGLRRLLQTTFLRRRSVFRTNSRRGEQLSGLGGQVSVLAVRRLPGVQRVYNLTVEGRHVYRVARCGVLVHNNGCGTGKAVHIGYYTEWVRNNFFRKRSRSDLFSTADKR